MSQADRFIRACFGQPHDAVPVWYMRQAGRFQPEYRELRQRYGMLEIAHNPLLAADVTLRPVEQFGVDAAILFSDIMVPVGPLGISYEIREGVGPVVADPIRSGKDVARLRPLVAEEDLPEVLEAVSRIVPRLHGVPLIGFTGAPFTLASYLVEGRPSREYRETKRLMWSDPAAWQALMDLLGQMAVEHLRAQVRHGAQAVQIFDSWVGALSPRDYRQWVWPVMRRLFLDLKDLGVPRIYFGVGSSSLLDLMAEADPDVMGLDWRVSIGETRGRLPAVRALQGNLDPMALLQPWPVLEREARAVLADAGGHPGYIFNLGHGVPPATDPATLVRLTALVHEVGVVEGAS